MSPPSPPAYRQAGAQERGRVIGDENGGYGDNSWARHMKP